ncbi:hypothetical protein FNV43_RR16269 [Rhamnella rubrinervis]|uniref:Trichome birefringence-like C-terminal domain-containing protein n=1 Tax=Rhamnella rubrinervis TaxID=2594499 RepID=A0A8K0E9F8_9ROSA|nr:hypothetical protein FNV43_RR16269 [Rhamnella rubrinervis]
MVTVGTLTGLLSTVDSCGGVDGEEEEEYQKEWRENNYAGEKAIVGRRKSTRVIWDYFQVGDKVVEEMDRMEAFKIALTTWSKWWVRMGVPQAKNYKGQSQPVKGSKYPGPSHTGEDIVKSVVSSMEKKVYLLDLTLLTQLRKDGHPSIFAGKGSKFVDCSHWCLPGVPDAWNEVLYALLIQN